MDSKKKKCAEVAVVMGSSTDWNTMRPAVDLLLEFGVKVHWQVLSAHRMPEEMIEFGKLAARAGYQVIIAGAGGAAHLPGMLASVTTLPVIGVPVSVGALQGNDALLSIVQMPSGIPVATVGIGNSKNAALLAVRILAIQNKKLSQKLQKFSLKQKQRAKAQKLDFPVE